jgi:ribosomal 30S subunit maturation factor RimM
LTPLPPNASVSGGAGAPEEVELGYVSGVFGVRGELRVFLHHPDSDTLATERRVIFTAPDGRRFTAFLRARSGAGKRILGVFEVSPIRTRPPS